MSGGSFEYACFADDLTELLNRADQYARIGEAFETDGYDDVAAEIASLLDVAKLYDRRVTARLARLRDLARAMEWQHSGDTGPEQTRSEVERWRHKMGEGT